MQDEQWVELIERIKETSKVKVEKEELITKDDIGKEMISEVERAIFSTDLGEFKVERITKPLILDKKVHYSHTAGNKGLVEYILSPTEKTSRVTVYKKGDRDEWEELSIGAEGLKF